MKISLRRRIKKAQRALWEAGMREAYKRGKNIQFGLQGRAVVTDDILETIYLPQAGEGEIDIRPLLILGAEVCPEEARKLVLYQEMLDRLDR